jgi:hypothetical protein
MLELQLELEFACCACGSPTEVTLTCAGKGLKAHGTLVAAVKVPCPTCGGINEVFFDQGGKVHAVAPAAAGRRVPEPSAN